MSFCISETIDASRFNPSISSMPTQPDPWGEPYSVYTISSDVIVEHVNRMLDGLDPVIFDSWRPLPRDRSVADRSPGMLARQLIGWENAPAWLAVGSLPLLHTVACMSSVC